MNEEKVTAIRITLDHNNQLQVETRGIILPNAIQLCLASIEALCKQSLERADKENPKLRPSLEEDMFEMINMGASTLLDRLFPNITMRPDVTVDAMLEEENKLIKEQGDKYIAAYNGSAQKVKDVYTENINKAKITAQEMAADKPKKKTK